MIRTRKLLLITVVFCGMAACKSKPVQVPMESHFKLGKVKFIHSEKANATGSELTLMTRFDLDKNRLSSEMSTYFQYQLGKKIKLIIDKDTLDPALSYYIPMIRENEKEIDSKFTISKLNLNKLKRVFIEDSSLGFNTQNVSFK